MYENVRHAFATQFFPPMAQETLAGQPILTIDALRSHSRHNTLGRFPLDEWSAKPRYLYLAKHNTHKRQTSMAAARFEPTIPSTERPQTQIFDRTATRIGLLHKLACSNSNPPCTFAERTYPVLHWMWCLTQVSSHVSQITWSSNMSRTLQHKPPLQELPHLVYLRFR